MRSRIDLTGQKFDKLTAVEYHDTKSGHARWRCLCDCGAEHIILATSLKRNSSNSCTRCSKYTSYLDIADDIIGKKFGNVTVTNLYASKKYRTTYCNCICDCGNIFKTKFNHIKSGISPNNPLLPSSCKSCAMTFKHGYRLEHSMFLTILSSAKSHAKKKSLEYNLTVEYLHNIYQKQHKSCAISGRKMITRKNTHDRGHGKHPDVMSLDRIDPSKGYIEGNVQLVTWQVNCFKSEFSQEQLIETARLIVGVADKKLTEVNNGK